MLRAQPEHICERVAKLHALDGAQTPQLVQCGDALTGQRGDVCGRVGSASARHLEGLAERGVIGRR
jgi:hypothetical protein